MAVFLYRHRRERPSHTSPTPVAVWLAMFELYTNGRPRTPRGTPLAASLALHVVLVVGIAVAAVSAIGKPPAVPTMMAFVAPSSVPPPAPPPAPATQPKMKTITPAPPVQVISADAPVEAPPVLGVESAGADSVSGIEGGVTGGVIGGIVGGIETVALTPPPAPALLPLALRSPVRIGGMISAPRVLTRVRPLYPKVAARAHIHGVVILEAIVDEEGVVQEVRVLRSVNYLDEPAIEALKQWRYEPLTLNGQRMPFLLTVSMMFSAEATSVR